MKVVIISKEMRDYSRKVADFAEEFRRRTGREAEMIDPDTRDGERTARTYDVMEYPTILVLRDSGEFVQEWRGEALPRIDDVVAYLV
jgi:hypothetical protein